MSCKIAGVDVSDVRIGLAGGGSSGVSKIVLGNAGGTGTVIWQKETGPQYFSVTFPSANVYLYLRQYGAAQLETSTTYEFTNHIIQYSTNNGATWTTWTESAASGEVKTRQFMSTSANQKILIRGLDSYLSSPTKYIISSGDAYYSSGHFTFSSSSQVTYGGDVRSLINFNQSIPARCFIFLFRENANLVSFPPLLATDIGNSGYYGFFFGCTALVNPPEIYATKIGISGMMSMFNGCTSLTNARCFNGNITSIERNSFRTAFRGCTSLVSGMDRVSIDVATVPDYAFAGMYEGCTSLENVTIPASSATTIEDYAYIETFSGCTALEELSTSSISATTIGLRAFYGMFKNCESLVSAPSIASVSSAGNYAFMQMFYGCTSLESFGNVGYAGTAPSNVCKEMFRGCTSLTSFGTILFTKGSTYAFSQMFFGCTLLQSVTMNIETTASSFASYMFQNCSCLLSIYTKQKNFTGCTSWLYNASVSAIGMTMHCTQALASVIDGLSTRSASNLPNGWTYVADQT